RMAGAQTCSYCGYIYEDQLAMNAASLDVERPNPPMVSSVDVSNSKPSKSEVTADETLIESQTQVMCKGPRGTIQGTLVLTKKRLAVVKPSELSDNSGNVTSALRGSQLTIPLDTIDSVSGQRGVLRTSLVVNWHNPPGSSTTTRTEFIQRYRAPSPTQISINEWIPLIEKEVWGEPENDGLESKTDLGELESQVRDVLTDEKWVGYFQLERELEEKYETSIDPDDLDKVLEKLIQEKVLEKEKVGEFFRKIPAGKK
ncbi:MAG: hypothetical protein OK457_07365, partial [Thaumarchaeota archaeon]|nr:hypothetical protein [Nitrososphaerota archaeon]